MSNGKITSEKMLIIGFPSVGLVGAFAAAYLVKTLDVKRVGELDFPKISPTFVIQDGNILGPMQIYQKENVYFILSSIPLDLFSTYEFVKKSIEFGKTKGIEKIIIPRGMEIIGKETMEPKSFGLATSEASKKLLKEYRLEPIVNASVYGSDAGVISALKEFEIPSLILYTICRLQYPDSDAIVKAIKTLANIMKVKVDTEKIEEKLETISEDNKRLMEETKKYLEKTAAKPASMRTPGIA